MASRKTKVIYDINFYKDKIQTVEATPLQLDQLGYNFVDIIQHFRRNANLDLQAMLFRPCQEYKPTVNLKLEALMEEELVTREMHVSKIVSDYYDVKQEPNYDKFNKVRDLFPNNFALTVNPNDPNEICQAEANFWTKMEACAEARYDVDYRAKETQQSYDIRVENARQEKIIAFYGADHDGSLFDHQSQYFNLLNFPNILPTVLHQYMDTLGGITTPHLYLGTENSPFPPHVEDRDTWSISYLHKGNPKIWYTVNVLNARVLEAEVSSKVHPFVSNVCGGRDGTGCDIILRHKRVIYHPAVPVIKEYGIRKIVQCEGDIVVIPPRCYHNGFNVSENIAEALNFTLPESLPFNYLAKICVPTETDYPTFPMDFFVVKYQPEKYEDFVNGRMTQVDPIYKTEFLVEPPVIHQLLKDGHAGLLSAGITQLLLAKKQDGIQYVYVNSPAGCSWLKRDFAETLKWTTADGDRPFKLRDEIFSMKAGIITRMQEITTCLKLGDDTGLERIFKEAEEPHEERVPNDSTAADDAGDNGVITKTERVSGQDHDGDDGMNSKSEGAAVVEPPTKRRRGRPRKPWNAESLPPCPICKAKAIETVGTQREWNRHLKTCNGELIVNCDICDNLMRNDYVKSHKRRVHGIVVPEAPLN